MKKKYLFIGITVILAATVIGLSIYIMTLRNTAPMISVEEAGKMVQNCWMDTLPGHQWEEEFMLDRLADIEIGKSEAYSFDIRFKESERLVASYAVTMDGRIIFWYDGANNVWIVQE